MTRIRRETEPLRSAFEGTRFLFDGSLLLAYGQLEKHPLGAVGSLLRCMCDVVNEPVLERLKRRNAPQHVLMRYPLPLLEGRRRELTELLGAAIGEQPGLVNPSAAELSEARAQLEKTIGWELRLERSPRGGPVLLHDAYIDDDEALIAVLRVALMHRQYRNLVKRCPECSKVFMKEGKRVFCSDACATAANDAGLAERQRHRRLRLAAQKLLTHVASRAKRAAAVKAAFKRYPEVTTPEQLAEYAAASLKGERKHK